MLIGTSEVTVNQTCSALALVIAACAPTLAGAQSSTSVGSPAHLSAELVQSGEDLVVTIQNNRAVPIEAWSFEVTCRTLSKRDTTDEVTTDAYRTLVLPVSVPDGPIAPQEKRAINLGPHRGVVVKGTRLLLALYSDLSYEGQPSRRDVVLRQWERDAADLERWLVVFTEARAKPPEEMKQHLRQALDLRRANPTVAPASTVDNGLDAAVERILTVADKSPALLPAAIDQAKVIFERQRELALRHRARR
jgi:hypothetical protein